MRHTKSIFSLPSLERELFDIKNDSQNKKWWKKHITTINSIPLCPNDTIPFVEKELKKFNLISFCSNVSFFSIQSREQLDGMKISIFRINFLTVIVAWGNLSIKFVYCSAEYLINFKIPLEFSSFLWRVVSKL